MYTWKSNVVARCKAKIRSHSKGCWGKSALKGSLVQCCAFQFSAVRCCAVLLLAVQEGTEKYSMCRCSPYLTALNYLIAITKGSKNKGGHEDPAMSRKGLK